MQWRGGGGGVHRGHRGISRPSEVEEAARPPRGGRCLEVSIALPT